MAEEDDEEVSLVDQLFANSSLTDSAVPGYSAGGVLMGMLDLDAMKIAMEIIEGTADVKAAVEKSMDNLTSEQRDDLEAKGKLPDADAAAAKAVDRAHAIATAIFSLVYVRWLYHNHWDASMSRNPHMD